MHKAGRVVFRAPCWVSIAWDQPGGVPKAMVGQVEATGSWQLHTAGLVTSGEV